MSVWICRANVTESWRVLGSIWTCKLNGTTFSNLDTKISFSKTAPNWRSKNRQSSRLVQMSRQPHPCTWKCCTKFFLGGHRCDACQRVSDDKVSVWKPQESIRDQSYGVFLYLGLYVPCFGFDECLYMVSQHLAVMAFIVALMPLFGNTFRLSNVGFDRPLTVYTVGIVTVRGIVYHIKWLVSIH